MSYKSEFANGVYVVCGTDTPGHIKGTHTQHPHIIVSCSFKHFSRSQLRKLATFATSRLIIF